MTVGKGGREWQRVLRGKEEEEALDKEEEEEGEALDLREIKAEKRDS